MKRITDKRLVLRRACFDGSGVLADLDELRGHRARDTTHHQQDAQHRDHLQLHRNSDSKI